MGLTVVDTEALAWKDVPDSWPGKSAADEPIVQYKSFVTGMPSLPSGQLVRFEAGHVEAPHSHGEDEAFIVLDGDLSVDGERLRSGSLAFIPAGTTYSPSTTSGCLLVRLGLRSG